MHGQSAAARGNTGTRLGSTIRNIADRVARLERKASAPTPVVIGAWRLEAEGDDLYAIHDNGTRRKLAALTEGE